MPAPNENIQGIIRSGLDREKPDYRVLLSDLRLHYENFSRTDRGSGHIYRIYSRGEKQSGDEFKNIWKISQKLTNPRNWREVNDIIGLTIVCPFLSDIPIITAHTDAQIAAGRFIKLNKIEHDSIYKAIHYALTLPRLRRLRCEVQIKTIFHDAWAAKAHDLTYRTGGIHDLRYSQQMDTLTTILSALEQQSEIIRELIHDSWHFDKDRRQMAQKSIIMKLSDDLASITDSAHREALKVLQSRITELTPTLAVLNAYEFSVLREEIDTVAAKHGYDGDLCRIVATIAVSRDENDCRSWLLECIDNWKLSLADKTPEELAASFHFAALVFYSWGDLERAIEQGEEGVSLRRQATNKDETRPKLGSALSCLAYYYAQLAGTPVASRLRAEGKARAYIREALELCPDQPEFIDTYGFVEISYGTKLEEVETGLTHCDESWIALRGSRLADVSDMFHKIHRRIAYRRFLAM